MNFEPSAKVQEMQKRLQQFMDEHIYPGEGAYLEQVQAADAWRAADHGEWKAKARAAGLWNLFLPESEHGAGLTNLEYAPLCEIMGRSWMASEAFNCSAPDTGNMEVLSRYGTPEQQEKWLKPLLAGEIRSCFSMTEKKVASSDATNIESSIVRDGDDYVINGHKWWSSGAGDPRCKISIFMGKTDPTAARHKQQSMILVPLDTPGVKVKRLLSVFGYNEAPHGHAEVVFEICTRTGVEHSGEGRGFEDRARAPGTGAHPPLHRLISQAERALELMCWRTRSVVAFGKTIAEAGNNPGRHSRLAHRGSSRRGCGALKAAWMMDNVGNKAARSEIAMIKVIAPKWLCR
jgi:acyl-CoA dehydrogenase